MSESKDTTIKLFGKTIISLFVAKHHDDDNNDHDNDHDSDDDGLSSSSYSSSCCPSFEPDKVINNNNNNLTDLNEEPKTTSEISSSRSSKNNGDQQSEITTITSNKKTLKKPDEILQCPRCKSNETKFCYYNNYNVNQPRHFCKNCQRYWTAGGSMRNVPIGSGRRKNKGWASSSSNQYFQINPEIKNNDSVNLKVNSDKVNSSDKGLLHPQVTFPVTAASPWSYQWSSSIPNGNFYPMPFYLGCTFPVWSSNISQCQEKRKRDQM